MIVAILNNAPFPLLSVNFDYVAHLAKLSKVTRDQWKERNLCFRDVLNRNRFQLVLFDSFAEAFALRANRFVLQDQLVFIIIIVVILAGVIAFCG